MSIVDSLLAVLHGGDRQVVAVVLSKEDFDTVRWRSVRAGEMDDDKPPTIEGRPLIVGASRFSYVVTDDHTGPTIHML